MCYIFIRNIKADNKYHIDSQLKYDYSTVEVCSGGLIHMVRDGVHSAS